MHSAQASRTYVEVSALITDPYDGLIRLLNDAQRFGLAIVGMTVEEQCQDSSVRLILGAASGADLGTLEARLARHPCVRRLTVRLAATVALPMAA